MSLSRTLAKAVIGFAPLALALAACSPVAPLNATAPDSGVETRYAVSYAQAPDRRLDIYAPASARGAPLVVFFYGGSWETGSRALYRFADVGVPKGRIGDTPARD